MPPPAARICFRSISKSYPGVLALDDVSFEVQPGCVHALIGENGAGKSTLMKILAGATKPDSGVIEIDGAAADLRDARAAQQAGVAIVYQEFNLVPHLSVSENVYLGRSPRSRLGLVRFNELHRQTQLLLAEIGVTLPVETLVERLSVAQQQMVEIAKALSLNAKILILDEPSAVLTPHELTALFRLIRRLVERGVSVIYISHRFDEVFELAQFVTVLRDGRHISTRTLQRVERAQLITECVGRPLKDEYPPRNVSIRDDLLCIDRLSAPGRFVEVSFTIRAGEVFALTGLVGSGRSSVAKAIFGAIPAGGTIRAGSSHGPFHSPRAAMRAGVALLPEDRRREGLMLARPIRENITLPHCADYSTGGLIRASREADSVRRALGELRIKAAHIDASIGTLSGGNQQKCLLARWLQGAYQVMILDEPTRGVDVGAKAEIHAIINAIAGRGMAILLISSDLPEAIGMADRVGVMCRGRLSGILENREREATQESILRLAIGEIAA